MKTTNEILQLLIELLNCAKADIERIKNTPVCNVDDELRVQWRYAVVGSTIYKSIINEILGIDESEED